MKWPWNRAEDELEMEVRHHIETLADAYERQGMQRAEALAAARKEFGPMDTYKEECRDERRWRPVEEILRDVRFGWRMLKRTPAVTATALLSLALGIGATSAIVTLADVLLWRTVGVPQPEQLSEVMWEAAGFTDLSNRSMGGNFRDGALHVADFFSAQSVEALRAAAGQDAAVTAQSGSALTSVSFDGRLAMVELRGVAGDFFEVLRLRPALGRVLGREDDDEAAPRVVVLSHRFWSERMGRAPDVVGRTLKINNHNYEVAGVLPREFGGITAGDTVELYTTVRQSPGYLDRDSGLRECAQDAMCWWMHPLLRKAPGVPEERLKAALDGAFAGSWGKRPGTDSATPHIRLTEASRGLGEIRREFGKPLSVLLGLVAMVLLAACANLANLLLARSVSREKEVALRVSLGGGRARLVRQFFTESVMLAVLGGLISVPVSMGIISALAHLVTDHGSTMVISAAPDARTLAGAAVLTLVTLLLFGIYPAWRAVGVDAAPALKGQGPGSGGHRKTWAPARLLVLAQVSVGVVLMTSAVLFAGNLWEIVHREAGLERGNVVMFGVRPGELGYRDAELRAFYQKLERRLAETPGVQHVGLSVTRPMSRGGWWDRARVGEGKAMQSAVHHVTPGFLDSLRIPVVAGRMMSRGEVESGAKVAVVSEEFAAKLGLAEPLGVRFAVGRNGTDRYEIVGVARNAQYADMKRSVAVMYRPFDYEQGTATVVLGTAAAPVSVLPGVRAAVREVNRDLPLVEVYTMEEQISRTLERERLFAWLCGGFGVLALMLCVVGLYGLLAHATARRTKEIGVRIALGPSREGILWTTLKGGLGLALGGLALGVPPAVWAMKVAIREELVGAGPFPHGALIAAIGTVLLCSVAAALLPAVRAASVDPVIALRSE